MPANNIRSGPLFGKIRQSIGAHGYAWVLALTLLASANVVLQFALHKTTTLTAWKGGGFGMYTTPHSKERKIYLEFKDGERTHYQRIFPASSALVRWKREIGPRSQAALNRLNEDASDFKYFPRDFLAEDLVRQTARFRWKEDMTGGIGPKDGERYYAEELAIVVTETGVDIWDEDVSRYQIYRYPAEN